jgi:hypothetical protein
MRYRKKVRQKPGRRLFRKTARPVRKNNKRSPGVKRGGIRL